MKRTREHTACVTQEIIDSRQEANLKLLFNLPSDTGIRNVQTPREKIIDTMCNQSAGIDFAGDHLYK